MQPSAGRTASWLSISAILVAAREGSNEGAKSAPLALLTGPGPVGAAGQPFLVGPLLGPVTVGPRKRFFGGKVYYMAAPRGKCSIKRKER